MSVWQIWGSFTRNDLENPTTIGTFRKGQRTPGGQLMEDLEKEFAALDQEVCVLLYEFDIIQHLADRDVHEHMPSEEMENAIANLVSKSYMEAWWKKGDVSDPDSKAESGTT